MKLTEMIRYDEGEKLELYKDTEGYWTIGVGHLLTKDPSIERAKDQLEVSIKRRTDTITHDESLKLLEKDLERTVRDVMTIEVIKTLDDARQKALANMVFQLGLNGVKQFKKMIQALEQKDYTRAATEAMNSRWARQTPNRARRVTDVIRKGDFTAYK